MRSPDKGSLSAPQNFPNFSNLVLGGGGMCAINNPLPIQNGEEKNVLKKVAMSAIISRQLKLKLL